MHRDISFSNLLLTRSTPSQLAVGFLIDFDYACHLESNDDISDERVVGAGDSSLHTPSPNFTVSGESSGALNPSLSCSDSTAGGKDADTGYTPTSDTNKGIAGNLRTVSLIF